MQRESREIICSRNVHLALISGPCVPPRCGITPIRQWDRTLTQMRNLRRNKAQRPLRTLTLLVWQAVIYWIWAERNARLHSNNFKSADSLFSTIDRQIRNKIQTLRESNPSLCSAISQLWFTHAWLPLPPTMIATLLLHRQLQSSKGQKTVGFIWVTKYEILFNWVGPITKAVKACKIF